MAIFDALNGLNLCTGENLAIDFGNKLIIARNNARLSSPEDHSLARYPLNALIRKFHFPKDERPIVEQRKRRNYFDEERMKDLAFKYLKETFYR